MGSVVANRSAQHGILRLKRVENRALRDVAFQTKLDFAADARQRPQMRRKYDPDLVHISCLAQQPVSGTSRASFYEMPLPGSAKRLDFDRENSRKIANDRHPAVTGVGRSVHLPTGSAEINAARIEGVDGHCVAQHVDEAVALG